MAIDKKESNNPIKKFINKIVTAATVHLEEKVAMLEEKAILLNEKHLNVNVIAHEASSRLDSLEEKYLSVNGIAHEASSRLDSLEEKYLSVNGIAHEASSRLDSLEEKYLSVNGIAHEASSRLDSLEEKYLSVNGIAHEASSRLDSLEEKYLSVNGLANNLQERTKRMEGSVQHHVTLLTELNKSAQLKTGWYKEVNSRLDKLKNETVFPLTEHISIEQGGTLSEQFVSTDAPIEVFEFDYLTFENIYRGPEETIKKTFQSYLPYFEIQENMLDVGCGRGEMLELWLENEYQKVKGIDLNKQMVDYCRGKDLDVLYADAIDYLGSNTGLDLGGVFSAQVIEHLTPNQIISFVRSTYKNLCSGGVFVIETINPMCLYTYGMSYAMDLTHVQPVHPYTLEFIMRTNGFDEVKIVYSSRKGEEYTKLSADSSGQIEAMYNTLFGFQNYAIIGRKV